MPATAPSFHQKSNRRPSLSNNPKLTKSDLLSLLSTFALSRNYTLTKFDQYFISEPMDSTQRTGSSQSTVYDPALLAELTQKVGSFEKAKEVYALFAASLMSSAPVIPPLTIPADSAAQPANLHEQGPQDSTS